jgi:uncharacterized protein
MIVPDINLLIYAYDQDSIFHVKAARWWQDHLSGTEPVGLLHVVAFGFLCVVTNARVFQNPMTVREAAGHIRSWLQQPVVQILQSGPTHFEQVLTLLENLGTAGNLVTDAQIAAVAIEHNAVLHSADGDFARLPGLRWHNPITGMGSRTLNKARRPGGRFK